MRYIPSNNNPTNIGRTWVYANLGVYQLGCSNNINGLHKQTARQTEKKKKREKKSVLAATVTFKCKENEMDKILSKEKENGTH